jgi:hypothetical protein
MIDYLKPTGQGEGVELSEIWSIVMDGFGPVWPASRTQLDGVSLGDAWPCNVLPGDGEGQMYVELKSEADDSVPFHKLSQWLTYSLLEPMQKILGWEIRGTEVMTGMSHDSCDSKADRNADGRITRVSEWWITCRPWLVDVDG